MSQVEQPGPRAEWSRRQQQLGNSPRAVLMKELHQSINDLIDRWHRDVLRHALGATSAAALQQPVLDAGCGYGRLASEAAVLGFAQIVGIDFEPGFCKQFSADFGSAVCGELDRLPFRPASLANAYAVTALMYLPLPRAQSALQSLDACLQPGARILLLEPSAEFNRAARLLLRRKRNESLTMPGFSSDEFYAALPPAAWRRLSAGSSAALTLALPLLVLLSRMPRLQGWLGAVVRRLDHPRLGRFSALAGKFALYRWAIYEKPA